ncbi:MAG: cytochrome-c peroxidase [Sphingomonadales bacterium]
MPPIPPDKIALGRDLFIDTRLSGDGSRSCATCHQPGTAFRDGVARAAGLCEVGRTAPYLHDGSLAKLADHRCAACLSSSCDAGVPRHWL